MIDLHEEEAKVDSQLQANRDELVKTAWIARIDAEQAEINAKTQALAEARSMFEARFNVQPAEQPQENPAGEIPVEQAPDMPQDQIPG